MKLFSVMNDCPDDHQRASLEEESSCSVEHPDINTNFYTASQQFSALQNTRSHFPAISKKYEIRIPSAFLWSHN